MQGVRNLTLLGSGEAGKSSRPAALGTLPLSARILFDVLALRAGPGPVEAGLAELAQVTRLSIAQVHRALVRLEAVGLIAWARARGRGGRSRITLRWVIHRPEGGDGEKRRPELAAAKFSSPYNPLREGSKKSHSGRRPGDLPVGSRALAWAMAQVREDLRARPSIDPRRRAVVMAALGPAVCRAMRRGEVRTRAELRALVAHILTRLDERRGLGEDLVATRRWAEWCVREGLRRVAETRAALEASRRLIAELQRDAEEARRAWADPAAAAHVAALLRAALRVHDLRSGCVRVSAVWTDRGGSSAGGLSSLRHLGGVSAGRGGRGGAAGRPAAGRAAVWPAPQRPRRDADPAGR